MLKQAFLALIIMTTFLPASSRTLPRPILIHGYRPTTASLRAEMLQEDTHYALQGRRMEVDLPRALRQTRFETVYDPMLRLKTYYDTHLQDGLTRTDHPYGHNRPGIGINF
ncbi:hypothetical protein JST97_00050 [bacterium]|nr:hypothetical protein [bacterium]